MTPHRDPNAHKGSVPNELTAFPERERERARESEGEGVRAGGRHSLWEIYVLPHKANGTRVSSTHTFSQPGEEVAWDVNPIREVK